MSVQVTLTIPDDLYKRAESLAELTQQAVTALEPITPDETYTILSPRLEYTN